MFPREAGDVAETGALVGKCSVTSVVVESWYEKQQYTCCLVVKRRTAAGSPATSTIIVSIDGKAVQCVLLLLSRGTKSNTLA